MLQQHTGNLISKTKQKVIKIAKDLQIVSYGEINEVFELLNFLKGQLACEKIGQTIAILENKLKTVLSNFENIDQLIEIAGKSIELAESSYQHQMQICEQNLQYQSMVRELQGMNSDLVMSLNVEKMTGETKMRELFLELDEKTHEKEELLQTMNLLIHNKNQEFIQMRDNELKLKQKLQEQSMYAKTSILELQQKNKILESKLSHLNTQLRQLKSQILQSTLYEYPGQGKSVSHQLIKLSKMRILDQDTEQQDQQQQEQYYHHSFDVNSDHPHSLSHDLQCYIAEEEEIQEMGNWSQTTQQRILRKQYSAIDINSIQTSKKQINKPTIECKAFQEFSPIKIKEKQKIQRRINPSEKEEKQYMIKSAYSMKNLHNPSTIQNENERALNKIHNFLRTKIVDNKLRKFKKRN